MEPSDRHTVPPWREEPSRPRERLSRGLLFMEVARLYGRRSSCPRAEVGAVAIRGGRIVATGYCGAPAGLPHCDEIGCEIVGGHCVRSIHAEANLVAWSSRTGTELDGTTIFCTHKPCYACGKLLAQAGIIELIYEIDYKNSGDEGVDLLRRLGIRVGRW